VSICCPRSCSLGFTPVHVRIMISESTSLLLLQLLVCRRLRYISRSCNFVEIRSRATYNYRDLDRVRFNLFSMDMLHVHLTDASEVATLTLTRTYALNVLSHTYLRIHSFSLCMRIRSYASIYKRTRVRHIQMQSQHAQTQNDHMFAIGCACKKIAINIEIKL
jgi:hypothetical protein